MRSCEKTRWGRPRRGRATERHGVGREGHRAGRRFGALATADEAVATVDGSGAPEIHLINADGSNRVRLTNDPANDDEPARSPDGSKIAFETYRDGTWEIYVINADGSGRTRLANNTSVDTDPAWRAVP